MVLQLIKENRMITTEGKTVEQISQEIADAVYNQGGRCTTHTNGDTFCKYGDGEGNHCAVGWLLPDEMVFMDFMGNVRSLLVEVRYEEGFENLEWIEENIDLLSSLQNLHDSIGDKSSFAGYYSDLQNIYPNLAPHFKKWEELS